MSAPAATSQISATRPLNTSSIPQIPGGEILTSCASMSLPGTYAGQVEPQQLAVQTFPSSTIDDFVYRGFVLAFMLLLALVIPFRAFGQGAAAPVFSPVSGGYHTVLTVTLSDSTSGAPIYYTTDGTVPTTQSTLYTGPITVGSSENLEAVALAPGGTLGPVVKAWYTIVLPAAVPVPSLAPGAYGAAQTIVLSDATPNATIYYTVTGTYPNTSSPIYTGPFIISKNTAVQALATATGYESSPVLSAAYTIAATAPTITPASGTYTTIQTATLSTPTPGAYMLYTTDGSTPTSSSKFYNGPFSISANETVNAVAFAANYTQSAVASMTYTVILPAAAPTFSPAAGSFVSAPNVTIKSVTAGATIYYTIDGSAPTTGSAVYSGPVAISANETLSAMALAPGGSASAVTQGAYVIDPPATAPVFSPVSAVYNTVQTVAITAAPGATIYYTIDGSQPTSQSTRYTGTIVVGTSTKVQAVALAPGQSLSPVVKAFYTIILPTHTPIATPTGGTYNKIQAVTLTDFTPGATIYYTVDGTYPTTSSPVYSQPFNVTTGTQVTAWASTPGYQSSAPLVAVYTVIAPVPLITPAAGNLQNTTTVTMTDQVPGARIYYTTDGSYPTTLSPTYTGPINLSPAQTTTEVFQAIAIATGYQQSANTISTFIVDVHAGILAQANVSESPTRSIANNFLGISANWDQAALDMGQATSGVDQIFRTLISAMIVDATSPLLIRIPADDTTLDNVQSAAEPLAELAEAINVNYTLGVDLYNNNLPLAQAQASAWLSGIPNKYIEAFEIGNEPDNYSFNGERPPTYNWADYLAQFQQWQQAVNATTGDTFGISGPSLGSATYWVGQAEGAIANGTLTPTIVTSHSYLGGLTQADGSPWPVDYLLEPAAATQYPLLFAPYVAAAHAQGQLFRMDELASFYGGGVPGISNTFSEALWGIDTLFNYVNVGMDGVNLSTGEGTQYALFDLHRGTRNGIFVWDVQQVNARYYAVLAFTSMLGNNARLLPVSTTTTANVSVWATVDDVSTVHLVVINKDQQAAGDVQITLPGYSTGTVRYLLAASYGAVNGVTFGGQTFDGTPDGTLQGTQIQTTITPVNGVFTLPDMPITCAAQINFTH